MKAIGKYVIVEDVHEEITSSSGLVLSTEDTDDLRYQLATVHREGELVDTVESGDEIYYDKHQGHNLRFEGKLYRVILERDIVICL